MRSLVNIFVSIVLAQRVIKPGPVTVSGFIRSTLGLGQGARSFVAAFRDMGLDVRVSDLGDKFHRSDIVEVDLGRPPRSEEGGVLIVHLNPPELSAGLFHLGRKQLKHKNIIGYWTWELPTLPKSWNCGFDYVDDVWVPTNFVAGAIRPHTKLPVRVIPYPIRQEIPSALERAAFGIPDDAFVCLTLCDVRSSAARKNPVGAIRAFRKAFGNNARVRLVVKISNSNDAPEIMAEIEREIGSTANIKLMLNTLSVADQAALIQCSDAVISLHRAEGFGLVLAEAMLRGKVVLATGWSGNMDFMSVENSVLIGYQLVPIMDPQGIYDRKLGHWAEPNLDEAVTKLQALAEDDELRRKIGAEAIRTASEYFSDERFREVISGLLVFCERTDGNGQVGLRTERRE
ncbi:MAG: glycosyltransferase family 4 protein [Gammaproteobacteria bacterium]|nr:glycosyltransferase family 4 protein [Gammaproteobacteria bacterium]